MGDVSFATVWRAADRAVIELTAGRAAKGYKRLPADQWTKIAETSKNPKATQEQVARATGVSRYNRGPDRARALPWRGWPAVE
jgi:hypothetical protein